MKLGLKTTEFWLTIWTLGLGTWLLVTRADATAVAAGAALQLGGLAVYGHGRAKMKSSAAAPAARIMGGRP
jgi:hypothetical protein